MYKAVSPSMSLYESHRRRPIYYSGPAQDSRLFSKKPRELPSKAVLRCMGGDLSAVVPSASRRPRTFGVLSVGQSSHSATSDPSISIERQCRTSTTLIDRKSVV